MPEDNDFPQHINTLIEASALAYRARRPHYSGPHYPIPPWHEDCTNDDPMIAAEFDFSHYGKQVHALYDVLYVDEAGWLRLNVKLLAVEAVTLKVEADRED